MDILETIFNSEKIHLTQSEKIFVKETFEILSIFSNEIEKIFLQKYTEIINSSKNKFVLGKEFFEFVQKLRYPISFDKLQKIKKLNLINKNVIIFNFEFNEKNVVNNSLDLQKLKEILNKI